MKIIVESGNNGWVCRWEEDPAEEKRIERQTGYGGKVIETVIDPKPYERIELFEYDENSRFSECMAWSKLFYWLKEQLGGPLNSEHEEFNVFAHVFDKDRRVVTERFPKPDYYGEKLIYEEDEPKAEAPSGDADAMVE